jgi:large subunit ribosomal protein L13
LLGEEITIVNCEKSVISGAKHQVLAEFLRKRQMGTWAKGPFYHRTSEKLVRRMIRGMLPHRQAKGSEAFKRIKCYNGVPESMKEKMETILEANVSKLPNLKYTYMSDIVKFLGGKH